MSLYSDYEDVTVSTTAIGFTAAKAAAHRSAVVTCETGAVRYRLDGTDPTASVGHVLDVGGSIILNSPVDLVRVRFIRRDGTDATIRVSYGQGPDNLSIAGGAIGGTVASGSTDAGNPVKIGLVVNTGAPSTGTTGQRKDAWGSAQGALVVAGLGSSGSDAVTALYLAQNGGISSLPLATGSYNGSSWDRNRGNATATGLASAARTTSTQSADQTNYNGRGAQIMLDVTATPNDAQTLQMTVEVKDSVSGKYVAVASFTALVASALGASPTTETYVYTVYPGAAETAATAKHEVQALPLGRTWRVNVVHSAAGSWTYSVGITNLV